MQPSEAGPRYTRTAIVLHWLIAALVVLQVGWGFWMIGIPKEPPGLRADAFNLHKSIGMTIFMLMALRLAWRAGHPPPTLPPMAVWQARLARTTHALFYAVLLLQPLVGYLGSEVSGYPVKYFGVTLPGWAGKHPELKEFLSGVHLVNAWTIVALVALHVAGAAKHALIDRDRLLARMGVGRV